MSRRRGSLAASPLLIGALTTLIVAVAVYLSYNALNGLPFTPTYDIKVELNEAAGLEKTNYVRIGGDLVGTVEKVVADQNPAYGEGRRDRLFEARKGRRTTAREQHRDRPVGIRARLEVPAARTRQLVARRSRPGATIPVAQTREPVQIEELFKMFDQKTRTAAQENSNTFGDAFAGRGIGSTKRSPRCARF